MTIQDKIQHLLITHLLKHGEIQLSLPGGTVLALGITQIGKHGKEFCEDYCWVETSRDGSSAYMDSYNMAVKCPQDKLVFVGNEDGEVALDII
jgi:hypothetical protein